MSIFNHFQHLKLSPSQDIALTKLEAFLSNQSKVFILKGYAGSGKTTILKGLIDYLETQEREVDVIAPTGKAAKVLREKTSRGTTIHRGIYNFEQLLPLKIESEDIAEKSFHYFFPIADKSNINRVIIVDEASMVSNIKSHHELFTFGTGKLLDDLLSYAKIHTTSNKIIFVGDPAQLPPVTDSKSLALDIDFFLSNDIKAEETQMTDVLRQEESNIILSNATKIRELLLQEKRNTLKFDYDETHFLNISDDLGPTTFVEQFPKPKIGNSAIITYSNNQAFSNNIAIREKIFPSKKDITVGDVIVLNNNNYHSYAFGLYNGDIAQVVTVSSETETQSAPVFITEGTNKVRKNISLVFRNITLKFPNQDELIQCKIIDSFLNNSNSSLSVAEMKALYINFIMRFGEKQTQRKNQGLPYFREGSEEFKDALKVDPYFNALKIKYAYSITCHKAQGSEWDTVFIDFRGRIGLNDDCLRWSYTAITRAKQTCYCIHAPNFDSFDAIHFEPIGSITSLPDEAIQFPKGISSEYHTTFSHPCKILKLKEVQKVSMDSPFQLIRVDTKEYLEIYHFECEDKPIKVQAIHKKNGLFQPFTLVSGDKETGESLIQLLNTPRKLELEVSYIPTNEVFSKLYSKVYSALSNTNLSITNIVENTSNYYINYYFQSETQSGYIQFYFNKNLKFTKAIPKVLNSNNFDELVYLISNFQDNAS
jgi:hypothetical protein